MFNKKRVYIISDLHLGGRPDEWDASGQLIRHGFQICYSYSQLTDFITWIGHEAEGFEGDTEIVINGDVVDFLADDSFDDLSVGAKVWTKSETEAIIKLKRIIERTREGSSTGPFDALRDFIDKGHELTLILGNHDVELSLPSVRRYLHELLWTPKGKLNFIYDGEAYTYGGLLIEHGNRYHAWNVIDHSALRQERSMLSRGLPIDENQRDNRFFSPPAGTLMVIHIINKLKEQYRFVDILKPETEATIPILLSLEPSLATFVSALLKAPRIFRNLLRDKLAYPAEPEWNGNLGGITNYIDYVEEVKSLDQILKDELGNDAILFPVPFDDESLLGGFGYNWVNDLCTTAREKFKITNKSAIRWCQNFKGRFNNQRVKCIHAALKCLAKDFSFNIEKEKNNYLEAASRMAICGKFEAIVFGHTHLPKKIPLQQVTGVSATYLNTGTWADVMKIPDAIQADDNEAFDTLRQFITAISKNNFEAYIKRYLSFVEVNISQDGSVFSADLFSYCGKGLEKMSPLTDSRI